MDLEKFVLKDLSITISITLESCVFRLEVVIIATLVEKYNKFAQYRNLSLASGRINLENVSFLHPTTLLPLGSYLMKNRRSMEYTPPSDPGVNMYLSLMMRFVESDSSPTRWDLMNRTYVPIVNLPRDSARSWDYLKHIFEKYRHGEKCGGVIAFKYLFSELIGNIYEHSSFETAFVMAQAYDTKGYVEVCFYDDGITIPGIFHDHGHDFPSDAHAIMGALNGISTKEEGGRGRGLNTNLRISTQGLKGQMQIVSRHGLVYVNKEQKKIYSLPDHYKLDGTLISVQIPYPAPEVDIYEYV